MKVIIILRETLNLHGISERELSRLTGIRQPSINDLCNNQAKHLPLENLAAICGALNVGINAVLKLVDESEDGMEHT